MARLPLSSEPEVDTGPPSPLRWLVLFGVWFVYATFGLTTVSLAPLVASVTRDLNISNAQMGLIFGTWQLMFILSAVPAGGVVDRYGVRLSLFAGAMILAISGLLRSVSVDYWSLLAAVAVMGIGAPMISTGAPKVVAHWFRGPERGFAMGIYVTGPAVGTMSALSLSNSLLMPYFSGDWRAVLRTWAVVALFAGLVWLAIAARAGVDAGRKVIAAKDAPKQGVVIGKLLGVPAVRLLLAMSVGIFLFNHGLNNWLPEILREKGMSPVAAGYWATIPTLVGLAGSLAIPRLATPDRRYRILGLLFVSGLLATLLLRFEQGPLLLAGLALQGIARSSMMTVAMLTLVEMPGIGERNAATAGGLFFSAAEVGGASGPVLLGVIHDAGGDFSACLAFLTGIMAVLILAAARLQQLAQRAAEEAEVRRLPD